MDDDEDNGTIFGSQLVFYFIGDTDYGDWSSADLYDHLSDTEKLGFDGTVQGRAAGSRIDATMNGDLTYWLLTQDHEFGPNWYCRAVDHIVTLRR